MDLKSITKSAAKLAVGAALTTGLAANAVAGWSNAGWTYSEGVLTEKVAVGTAWAFNVTASDFDLTLQSVKTKGDNLVLDLNTPIDGGYKIRTNVESQSLFQKRSAGWVDEIILPRTMTVVEKWSFENCFNTITIPDNNEIETLKTGCFWGSYLTGRVVLPKLTTMEGDADKGPFHKCSRLYELDLGSDFHGTGIQDNLTKLCEGLTTFTARGVPFEIKQWSMEKCTKMNTWTFYGYPTLVENWGYLIPFGKTHRLFIKQDEQDWVDMMGRSAFTPWASESCDKETYFANFGTGAQVPLGYTTDPFAAYVLAIPEESDDGAQVLVRASGTEIGAPEPGYGKHSGIVEATTFTVPQYSHDGNVLHESTGYDLATWSGEIWVPDGSTVSARSWTFTPVGDEYKRITWNWRVAGCQVDVKGVFADCSVTTSSCTTVEGYVAAGSTMTLTANGEGFSRWLGVPNGVDAFQRTISFVVLQPLELTPVYGRGWKYDAAAHTISDGYWTILVSEDKEEKDNLTLEEFVKTTDRVVALDLDKPVSDGMKIAKINRSRTLFQMRASGLADEIILPKTLKEVVEYAFECCYNTITLPEDNEIETLKPGCFKDSYLTGRVVLPNLTMMEAGANEGAFHKCSRINELDLGPGFHGTGSPDNLAKLCGALTNFTARGVPFAIKEWSMEECTKMNTWTFNAYPTLSDNWAYQTPFGKHVRLFINKSNPDWQAMLKSDAFTPWASESCDKTTYFANFGANAKIPLGYTTKPFEAYVLKTTLFAKPGMMIFVQ